MNYGLYLSAAGVLTNMHRQDVAANNLSNVSTDGFKRDMVLFRQRDAESVEDQLGLESSNRLLDRLGGGVMVDRSRIDLTGGPMKQTGRTLDLAIRGKGFFVVGVDEGSGAKPMLSRDGRFTLRATDNQIVTAASGHALLDDANQPITVDPAAGPLQIDADGSVRQAGALLAKVNLLDVKVDDLRQHGGGVYETASGDLTGAAAAPGQIEQGFLEQSNVDPIAELMKLINATKAVTANGNLIRYHDSIMDRAANVLGRVA